MAAAAARVLVRCAQSGSFVRLLTPRCRLVCSGVDCGGPARRFPGPVCSRCGATAAAGETGGGGGHTEAARQVSLSFRPSCESWLPDSLVRRRTCVGLWSAAAAAVVLQRLEPARNQVGNLARALRPLMLACVRWVSWLCSITQRPRWRRWFAARPCSASSRACSGFVLRFVLSSALLEADLIGWLWRVCCVQSSSSKLATAPGGAPGKQ